MTRYWFTKTTDIQLVLDEMLKLGERNLKSSQVASLRDDYDKIRPSALRNPWGIPWGIYFIRTLVSAAAELGDDYNARQFTELLLAKHMAYGMTPLTEYWELGILIRIGSKIGRWETLNDHPERASLDETRKDTLRDIMGYAVLGYYMTTRIAVAQRENML